jgi:hypothetical protein
MKRSMGQAESSGAGTFTPSDLVFALSSGDFAQSDGIIAAKTPFDAAEVALHWSNSLSYDSLSTWLRCPVPRLSCC